MKTMKLTLVGLWITVALYVLVGCSDGSEIEELATSTNMSTDEGGVLLPLPSETSIPELTWTISPTQTSTQQYFPTLTPLPTLSNEQAKIRIAELLESNGGCDLPCWWGITPGESALTTTYQFLSSFVDEITEIEPGYLTFQEEWWFEIRYPFFENQITQYSGTVRYVQFMVSPYEDKITDIAGFFSPDEYIFKLSTILSKHGKPERVIIHVVPLILEPQQRGYPFEIFLYFPDQHIITHHEIMADKREGIIYMCDPEPYSGQFYLWSPGTSVDFEQYAINNISIVSIMDEAKPTRYLEDVTNMDIDTFYETFVNPQSSTCLESSEDEWLIPLD